VDAGRPGDNVKVQLVGGPRDGDVVDAREGAESIEIPIHVERRGLHKRWLQLTFVTYERRAGDPQERTVFEFRRW
jgi:hypothetical protein